MIYGSVCSGIEAASVAWEPLGWKASFFSEIEAFPRAVLAHRWPDIACHGDFTTIKAGEYRPIDLLVGGTPCQSFSIAGLRGGLSDERGNLALEYLRLADRLSPRWLVWENVPGVLSSAGGRDFGAILGGMVELGYGFAYRVLDAQYVRVDGFGRAVPQRRRRVFVVGHLGDWRRAAAVLFEPESLLGNPAPRRQAGEGIARAITAGFGRGSEVHPEGDMSGLIPEVAGSLDTECGGQKMTTQTARNGHLVSVPAILPAIETQVGGLRQPCTQAYVIDALPASFGKGLDHNKDGFVVPVAHALRADGFDASEDGTGRGTPIVPVAFAQNQRDELREMQVAGALAAEPGMKQQTYIAFSCKDHGADAGETYPTLRAMGHAGSHANAGGQVAVAIQERAVSENLDNGPGGSGINTDGAAYTLEARNKVQAVQYGWRVRRLTPTECERLQGFPDGYTDIPRRGKEHSPDGPRYKALGNSMAVNVMRWIGRRIEMVERNPA